MEIEHFGVRVFAASVCATEACKGTNKTLALTISGVCRTEMNRAVGSLRCQTTICSPDEFKILAI